MELFNKNQKNKSRAFSFIFTVVIIFSLFLTSAYKVKANVTFGQPLVSSTALPSVFSEDIRGGHHQVADTYTRDAIFSQRRTIGMLVFVIGGPDAGKTYRLVGGIANANWTEVIFGGGGTTMWDSFKGTVRNYIFPKKATSDDASTANFDESKDSYVGIGTITPQEKLTIGEDGGLLDESNIAQEMRTPLFVTGQKIAGTSMAFGTLYFKVSALDVIYPSIYPLGETTISVTYYECKIIISGSGQGCEITWDPVPGASGYNVYYIQNPTPPADSSYTNRFTVSTNIAHFVNGDAYDPAATPPLVPVSTGVPAPTSTTAYVNKFTAAGGSWVTGGNVAIGMAPVSSGYGLLNVLNAITAQIATFTDSLYVGGVAANAKFIVDNNGDITKIKNVNYSWPSTLTPSPEPAFGRFLNSDSSGNLSWADASDLATQAYVTTAVTTGIFWRAPVNNIVTATPPGGSLGHRYLVGTLANGILTGAGLHEWDTVSGTYKPVASTIGWAVLDLEKSLINFVTPTAVYENTAWVFDGTVWVQFNAQQVYTAGTGINISSTNVISNSLPATVTAGDTYVLICTGTTPSTCTWTLSTPPTDNWALTGNAGTTAGTHFIGTTDVQDLVFKTSAVINIPLERMRILANNGYVGIGTATPITQLDVSNPITGDAITKTDFLTVLNDSIFGGMGEFLSITGADFPANGGQVPFSSSTAPTSGIVYYEELNKKLQVSEDSSPYHGVAHYKLTTNPLGDPTPGHVLAWSTTDRTFIPTDPATISGLPSGNESETLRYTGGAWVSNNILWNDGKHVAIGDGISLMPPVLPLTSQFNLMGGDIRLIRDPAAILPTAGGSLILESPSQSNNTPVVEAAEVCFLAQNAVQCRQSQGYGTPPPPLPTPVPFPPSPDTHESQFSCSSIPSSSPAQLNTMYFDVYTTCVTRTFPSSAAANVDYLIDFNTYGVTSGILPTSLLCPNIIPAQLASGTTGVIASPVLAPSGLWEYAIIIKQYQALRCLALGSSSYSIRTNSTTQDGDLEFLNNNLDPKVLITQTGNVGIGVNAPWNKLQIHNPTGSTTVYVSTDDSAAGAGSAELVLKRGGTDGFMILQDAWSKNSLTFANAVNPWTRFMTITQGQYDINKNLIGGGNVGIGLEVWQDPLAKLSIRNNRSITNNQPAGRINNTYVLDHIDISVFDYLNALSCVSSC